MFVFRWEDNRWEWVVFSCNHETMFKSKYKKHHLSRKQMKKFLKEFLWNYCFFFGILFCGKMPTPKFSAFVKSLPCVGSIVTVCKNIIWIHWMLLVYGITGILTLCRELTYVYLFIYFAVVDFRWLPVVLIFPMCVMWWTLICQLTLRSMFTVLAVLVVLDTLVMSPLQIKQA